MAFSTCMFYVLTNYAMILNHELQGMRKKAVVAYLNCHYFYVMTEEPCGMHHSRCPGLGQRIGSVNFLTLTLGHGICSYLIFCRSVKKKKKLE